MMNNTINTITFDIKGYGDNTEKFWNAVRNTLRILVDNGYDCSFRYEDCGIYVIQFDYSDPEISSHFLQWLSPEEFEDVVTMRRENLTID